MVRMTVATLLCTISLLACVNSQGEDEADAEANGGGKADDFSFKFGLFHALDDHNEEGNERIPLLAAFHQGGSGLPAGDHGHFDLVRYTGDSDSTYVSGTFKLYKWQGRDRIRFSDSEGRIVWRTDWAVKDDNLELDGHGMYQQNLLEGTVVDCVAVDILDSNVFEEGLSTYEYPDVEVTKVAADKYELGVGAASYDASDTTITVESNATELVARAKTQHATYTLRVAAQAPRRGELLAKEGSEPESAVATVVCR